MVKKLLKHEFIYYARTLAVALPLIIAVGIITRIFLFLDNGSIVTNLAIGSSALMLYLGSMALIIFTSILNIVRFYKNMYSSEGYLTFTLPVTNDQHIIVKMIAAVAASASAVLAIIISALIALSGEPLVEIAKAFEYIFEGILTAIPTGHLILFIIEALILFLIATVSAPLFYYTCITIGQTAKKNRIMMAVGVYFIYYIATQIIYTVLIIIITVLGAAGGFDWVINFVFAHPAASMHIFLCTMIVVAGAVTAAYYYITRRIMSRKLNLE